MVTDMHTRRRFVGGLAAASIVAGRGWANAGRPAVLSAAQTVDGRSVLVGLHETGAMAFQLALPARGHAAAVHPEQAVAVAFARRPGSFAIVIDCVTGTEITHLFAPKDHHFYGHGAFSEDGKWLFTTENNYDDARGMIGVWDVAKKFNRVGAFPSGGIGPHDIKLAAGSNQLIIANGGIETHPDSGRSKLNLATMRPNLARLSPTGEVLSRLELPNNMRRNSIRHLATNHQGDVAFAMQWQGNPTTTVPLLGTLDATRSMARLFSTDGVTTGRMRGYAGSVAWQDHSNRIAITSPRGNAVQIFDADGAALVSEHMIPDVCGVTLTKSGFIFTSGRGGIWISDPSDRLPNSATITHPLKFDNHLVPIGKTTST
jgi:hypothetical protein